MKGGKKKVCNMLVSRMSDLFRVLVTSKSQPACTRNAAHQETISALFFFLSYLSDTHQPLSLYY